MANLINADGEILTKYECSRCGHFSDARYQAELCCPTAVYEKFVCSICEFIFLVESHALKHVELSHSEESQPATPWPVIEGLTKD